MINEKTNKQKWNKNTMPNRPLVVSYKHLVVVAVRVCDKWRQT